MYKAIKQLAGIMIICAITLQFAMPVVFAAEATTPSETSNDEDFKKCLRDTFNQERTTVCADILVEDKKCADSVFQDPVIRGCFSLDSNYELGGFSISPISYNISVCPNELMDKAREALTNCGRIYTAQCDAKIRDYCGEEKTPDPPTEPEPETQQDEEATEQTDKKTTVAPAIPKIETLPGPSSEMKLEDANKYLTSNLLPHIARTVTGIAITLSVIFIIFGAIQLLIAYGNEEKLGNAKKTILFAIVGLMISLLAFAIVQIIFFTGFQVTQIK